MKILLISILLFSINSASCEKQQDYLIGGKKEENNTVSIENISTSILVEYSASNELVISADEKQNSIKITFKKGDEKIEVAQFNYYAVWKNFIFHFKNGNIVGMLPRKNPGVVIKEWQNSEIDTELFFITNDGQYKEIGLNENYIEMKNDLKNGKVWILTPNEYKIYYIQDNGVISENIFFKNDIPVDGWEIVNNGTNIVIIKILGMTLTSIFELNMENKKLQFIKSIKEHGDYIQSP